METNRWTFDEQDDVFFWLFQISATQFVGPRCSTFISEMRKMRDLANHQRTMNSRNRLIFGCWVYLQNHNLLQWEKLDRWMIRLETLSYFAGANAPGHLLHSHMGRKYRAQPRPAQGIGTKQSPYTFTKTICTKYCGVQQRTEEPGATRAEASLLLMCDMHLTVALFLPQTGLIPTPTTFQQAL